MTKDFTNELKRVSRQPTWGSMVPDYILETARNLQVAIGDPSSKEEWLNRCEHIKRRLLHSLGLDPFPDRGPLNSRVVGVLNRKGYRIEKVIYEARPGFLVAAHLYLPEKLEETLPAIIHAPGHWMDNAKLETDLQHFCVGMVNLGFIVLIYDPIGQGERRVDWHNHGQMAQLLVGLDQTGLLVWEVSRAVDYLLSRPEVDKKRIGLTGASGGGQMAAFAPAIDDRIATAVSVCYSDTYYHLLTALRGWNWNGGIDLCNQIPKIISYARLSDILGLHAPRPFLMINGTLDSMFPIQGAREVYSQLKIIYNLMNCTDIASEEVDSPHGYDQKMREIAYGWFMQKFKGEGDGKPIQETLATIEPLPYKVMYLNATADPIPEKAQTFERDNTLDVYCLKSEQIISQDTQILAETCARAEKLPPFRDIPTNASSWSDVRHRLIFNLNKLLGPFPERLPMGPSFTGGIWTPAHVQITNRERLSNGWAERIIIESEPGILLPSVYMYPDVYQGGHPVVVYLNDKGKEEALQTGIPEELVRNGYGVFTLDLRCTGESVATEFENVTTSWMLDRDCFSWHVWDITRAIDYLSERAVTGIQHDKQRIVCWGLGLSALEAIFAGALDIRISGIISEGAPYSYKSLLMLNPTFPIGGFVFDVLNYFEITQVASLLAPRPFLFINSVDGQRKPIRYEQVKKEFEWCRRIYDLVEPKKENFESLIDQEWTPQKSISWLEGWVH
jgi:hypothetical protein